MDSLAIVMHESRADRKVIRWIDLGEQRLWWEYEGEQAILPPPLISQDMAATALIFYAMRRGRNLHILGKVSHSLLANLEELNACWVVWRPDLYKRIAITCDEEVTQWDVQPPQSQDMAIAAFSGGVDASFSMLRHHNRNVGRRSKKILSGVLIQGMDIPLSEDHAFSIARENAASMLDSLGLPLVTAKTNWRAIAEGDWEMEFGTAVSTCLRAWQGVVGAAILGSDEDYSRLVLPWGGNPITYSMLSSTDFDVVYDGGDFARTEKVEYLSTWQHGINGLRVCWQGPQTGRNCGVCEKCMRTKLNFMAVDKPLPLSLPGYPSLHDIFGIRAYNSGQLALLEEVVTIASRRGSKDIWILVLKGSILKSRIANLTLAVYGKVMWRIRRVYKMILRLPMQERKQLV